MVMPIDLVLVRHGESEGNVAKIRSKAGDNSAFATEFSRRLGSQWRLTQRGAEQASKAGDWIRENISLVFDKYYVSEYTRAKETAGLLNLLEAEWFPSFYLREREWGEMDVTSEREKQDRFADSLRRRESDGFFWIPPNCESLAQLCLRIDRVLDTLQRECSDKRVIAVCHGEVMWAFRVQLERMSQQRFRELDISKRPYDKIHNCQILHYTRRNPENCKITPYYMWMRSVCPSDTSLSSNIWMPIERPRFSNEDLLEEVELTPRIIS